MSAYISLISHRPICRHQIFLHIWRVRMYENECATEKRSTANANISVKADIARMLLAFSVSLTAHKKTEI